MKNRIFRVSSHIHRKFGQNVATNKYFHFGISAISYLEWTNMLLYVCSFIIKVPTSRKVQKIQLCVKNLFSTRNDLLSGANIDPFIKGQKTLVQTGPAQWSKCPQFTKSDSAG